MSIKLKAPLTPAVIFLLQSLSIRTVELFKYFLILTIYLFIQVHQRLLAHQRTCGFVFFVCFI